MIFFFSYPSRLRQYIKSKQVFHINGQLISQGVTQGFRLLPSYGSTTLNTWNLMSPYQRKVMEYCAIGSAIGWNCHMTTSDCKEGWEM